MKARVKWVENETFVGTSQSQHSFVFSGDPEQSASPMEFVLMGLGSCSAIDVVDILKKGRAEVISCHVEVEAERAQTIPKVFTKIHMKFVVKGKDLNQKKVKRAISLSADKYCSISRMIEKSVKLSQSYEIIE